MPSSLEEAITLDLDNYELRGKRELEIYCRYLFGVSCGLTSNSELLETKRYAINKGEQQVKNEIEKMIREGNHYLNLTELLDDVSKIFIYDYLNKNKIKNNNEVTSITDAIMKMIDYNAEVLKIENLTNEKVKEIVNYVLNGYVSNQFRVFSSKNGTRKYMEKEDIKSLQIREKLDRLLNENNITLKQGESVMEVLTNKISDKWLSKNISAKDRLFNEIDKMNLNDKQKQYVKNSLKEGNSDIINSLIRYNNIDRNLIEEFIKEQDMRHDNYNISK